MNNLRERSGAAQSSLSTPKRHQVVVVKVGLAGVVKVCLLASVVVVVFQLLDEVVGRRRDGVGVRTVRRELAAVRRQSKVQVCHLLDKFWPRLLKE